MNALLSAVPPAQIHPLLLEPNTTLLSLRIPKKMQELLIEKAENENSVLNKEVRAALAEYLQPTAPRPLLAPTAPLTAPLTEEQKALDAFGNNYVVTAIRSVAHCIENGTIECTAKGILVHFLSFCPKV